MAGVTANCRERSELDDVSQGSSRRKRQNGQIRTRLQRTITNTEFMREVLAEHLALQPDQIIACRVGQLRNRDGYRLLLHYDLRILNTETGLPTDLMVSALSYTGGRTRKIWEAIAGAGAGAWAAKAPWRPCAYVPALDLLLQVFPFDFRLRALVPLLNVPTAELAPQLLAAFGPGTWQFLDWEAEAIHYRVDRRATLRAVIRAQEAITGRIEDQGLFIKVYAVRREASQAHLLLQTAHQAVTASPGILAVPAPIAFSERLSTVIQAASRGTSLLKLVRREHQAADAVALTARALASLHQLAMPLDGQALGNPPRSLPDRLTRLNHADERLGAVRPDLASEISEIVDAVRAGLADPLSVPTHGDLKLDHVLLRGDEVDLIDLDFLRPSDPVLDVATLEGYLAREGQRAVPGQLPPAGLATHFVDEYFRHVPASWSRRLPFYHAMSKLHTAAQIRRVESPAHLEQIAALVRAASSDLERAALS